MVERRRRGNAGGLEILLRRKERRNSCRSLWSRAPATFLSPSPPCFPAQHLIVAITTDRGLCGSVNSSLARQLRKELDAAAKASSSVRLFILGEKGRQQISRDYTPLMARSIDGLFERDPIFSIASEITTRIIAQPYEVLTFWFNQYENQVKFHNVYRKIPSFAGKLPASLAAYEIEDSGANGITLDNLSEYAVAGALAVPLIFCRMFCLGAWRRLHVP